MPLVTIMVKLLGGGDDDGGKLWRRGGWEYVEKLSAHYWLGY